MVSRFHDCRGITLLYLDTSSYANSKRAFFKPLPPPARLGHRFRLLQWCLPASAICALIFLPCNFLNGHCNCLASLNAPLHSQNGPSPTPLRIPTILHQCATDLPFLQPVAAYIFFLCPLSPTFLSTSPSISQTDAHPQSISARP